MLPQQLCSRSGFDAGDLAAQSGCHAAAAAVLTIRCLYTVYPAGYVDTGCSRHDHVVWQ